MRVPTDTLYREQNDLLSSQYERYQKAMLQSDTHQKIQYDSEDPVLAFQINGTVDYISAISKYEVNKNLAGTRSERYMSTMEGITAELIRIKGLIETAGNDTWSQSARNALGVQLQGSLNTIFQAVNATDGSGQYIYSGYSSNIPPFIKQADGTYVYQGGLENIDISISPNISVTYGDSGYGVFCDILNGNGKYAIAADSANTGKAYMIPGGVSNTTYVPDDYTITFVTNGAGELAYQVIGASSGQVIPPLPATIPNDAPAYVDGLPISVNGMTFSIAGPPNVGDKFTVNQSKKENIFDFIQQFANSLTQPTVGDGAELAKYKTQYNQMMLTFDQIFDHLSLYQADVGTRKQAINNQSRTDQSVINTQSATYTKLSVIDDYVAYSSFIAIQQQIETTQSIYVQMQRTLMQFLKNML